MKTSGNVHADSDTFRKWLVKQLKISRWTAVKGEDPRALAERLGVTFPVLKEAVELRRAEALVTGKAMGGSRLLLPSDYHQIRIGVTGAVQADWEEFVKTLRVHPSAVLRSLIHHFLLHPEKLKNMSPYWMYKGEFIKSPRSAGIKSRITRGAMVALDHHSRAWGVTSAGIYRGLITDVLEGRLRRFKIVAYSELWGDPDRYLQPERFK